MNALRKKRPDMYLDTGTVIYHQDNAPSHTAHTSQLELDLIGFDRLSHPPYSPDLAPLDFAYFPKLKEHLRGQRFENFDELKLETQKFNRSLKSEWFQGVFDSWVKRHRRCIEHNGEYFEKE